VLNINRYPWPNGKYKRISADQILYALYGDSVGTPDSTDRFAWPVDALGAKRVDWASGDGTTPAAGPTPLTKIGTVTAGRALPWRSVSHGALTCSEFANASALRSPSAVDPTLGHDAVLLLLARKLLDGALFSTQLITPRPGISVYVTGSVLTVEVSGSVDGPVTVTAPIAPAAWHLIGVTIEVGSKVILYVCGVQQDDALTPAGTLGEARVYRINDYSGGGGSTPSDIRRVLWWTGAGIAATADDAWHATVSESVLGMRPDVGELGTTFVRGSAATYYPLGPAGRVHIMGLGCPSAGNVEGIGSDEEIVTTISKNYNLVDGDTALVTCYAIPWFAILPVLADDAAALSAAGLREVGPNVIDLLVGLLDVPGPGVATYLTATFGQVVSVPGWASIRAVASQGDWVFGLYDPVADDYYPIADIAGSYVRTSGAFGLIDFGAAYLAVWCTSNDAGDHLKCIFWCAGSGERVQDEVPSQDVAGVSTTKSEGIVTTAHDPSNVAGTLNLTQTPRLWGTVDLTSAGTLIELTASEMIGVNGGGGEVIGSVKVDDGTNEANADLVEVDGTPRTVRAAWDVAGLYAAVVGEDDGTAAYDGAWPAGTIELRGTCRATQAIVVWSAANKTTVA
jgi:hypothetical protein